jgi:hypothetical protein
MNIREAKAIIAKAENEYQKKLANEVHLKMADLGAPAKTLLGAGIGAGLGAGASFLGSEFVGMPKEDDPDLAALKLKRRRLGALLAGAGMGSLGGAVVGNVGVLDNMLTPTDPNAPNTNGPSAMEKWKGDLGKWWNSQNLFGIAGMSAAGAGGVAMAGSSNRAARIGTVIREFFGKNDRSWGGTKAPKMGTKEYSDLIKLKANELLSKNKGMLRSDAIQEARKQFDYVKATPATQDKTVTKTMPSGNVVKKTIKGTPAIPGQNGIPNRLPEYRRLANQRMRGKISNGGLIALLLGGGLAAANALYK